jgi:hypothetical protein
MMSASRVCWKYLFPAGALHPFRASNSAAVLSTHLEAPPAGGALVLRSAASPATCAA